MNKYLIQKPEVNYLSNVLIKVNGKTYEIGKSDFDRVVMSSSDPINMRRQVRKLRKKYVHESFLVKLAEIIFGHVSKQAAEIETTIYDLVAKKSARQSNSNNMNYSPKFIS